jgi:hypothetical protein
MLGMTGSPTRANGSGFGSNQRNTRRLLSDFWSYPYLIVISIVVLQQVNHLHNHIIGVDAALPMAR